MRLSMEEVQKMKNWFTNYVSELSELGKKVRDIFSIEEAQNLFDTIEALQQENEQLRESAILAHKIADAHMAKNEQLQAQVARMRDVLDELTSELDYAHLLKNGIEWDKHKSKTFDCALELLKNIPANYHNPADVEALRKAREALDYWRELYGIGLEVLNWHMNGDPETFDNFYDNSGTYEALAEIDKAIGGKEDV